MILATSTLQQLVDLYSLHHPGLKASTVSMYRFSVRSLEKHYGYELRACDLDEELVLPWIAARAKVRAPRTVKRERSDVLTLWRFAYKRGLCRTLPFEIPTIRVPRRVPNSWTPAEYGRIVAACEAIGGKVRQTDIPRAIWWRSLLTFLYYAGCRIGAAMAVEPRDVDLSRMTVTLRADAAKTDFEQVVPLHPDSANGIQQMMAFGYPRIWPLFVSRRRIWQRYKRILKIAGLPCDRSSMFQRTRRTTYTLCVKFGSKEIASKQLGHRTDMSRFYLDPTQLSEQTAADLLPRF